MEFIDNKTIEDFSRDGAVLCKGMFIDWLDELRIGVDKLIENPSVRERSYTPDDGTAPFFQDLVNWDRIPEFKDFVFKSKLGFYASKLMKSKQSQFFHDHVLVKEAGTLTSTPWHTDGPYYFVKGIKTLSFWVPLDPVKDATLRMVAGSHRWPKPVLPTRWLSNENFYPTTDEYLPVPDPEKEHMDIKEFNMEPGDAVAFNFNILHGARGATADQRRRAFSLRLLGDDTSYTERPGPTSPPFPQHNMEESQVLRTDWFPFIEF